MLRLPYEQANYSKMKNIKKTALRWRQKMEEAPRYLCPNDLSDKAFVEALTRALWKRGETIDIQGDSYQITKKCK